jgi:hypothetical protein
MTHTKYASLTHEAMKKEPKKWKDYEVWFGNGEDVIITVVKDPDQKYRWHYAGSLSSVNDHDPKTYIYYLRPDGGNRAFKTSGAVVQAIMETNDGYLMEACKDLKKQLL